jgi:hypothetical protein
VSAVRPLALLALLLTGCATLSPRTQSCDCGGVSAQWMALLSTTSQLAEAGRFDAADSALHSFAATWPGTREAEETAFWRALYRIDPRNPAPQPGAAVQLLDQYLLSDSVYWYRAEARVLRQLAVIQAGGPPATVAVEPGATIPPIRPRADQTAAEKDLEIQQLRERVARLNEELERIRRRLSSP